MCVSAVALKQPFAISCVCNLYVGTSKTGEEWEIKAVQTPNDGRVRIQL